MIVAIAGIHSAGGTVDVFVAEVGFLLLGIMETIVRKKGYNGAYQQGCQEKQDLC